MRLIPRVFILATIFVLLLSYQNFSSVDSSAWDSTPSLKIINEMNTFEHAGKQIRPSSETLAVPHEGNNLESVSRDWMQRQASLILNGFDKEVESTLNERLNSWIYDANEKQAPNESVSVEKSTEEISENPQATVAQKTKQKLRFSHINSLKYDLGEKTCMNLTADPGNTRFQLSQSLSLKAKIGVEHQTTGHQTHMYLKYEW